MQGDAEKNIEPNPTLAALEHRNIVREELEVVQAQY
jgi:hypothetical protein